MKFKFKKKEDDLFYPEVTGLTDFDKAVVEFISAVEQSILNGGNSVSREKVNVSYDEESYNAVILAGNDDVK